MDERSFYRAPGPMTDLSSADGALFDGLPGDPAGLMQVVRGCVTSDLLLMALGLPVPTDRGTEPATRPARDIVRRISELDGTPLANARTPENRFLGNCRTFATLSCALLRRAGITTRVRAGFAGYFQPNVWADHWIIEYKSDSVWIRVDPQLDDEWLTANANGRSSEDLARDQYLSGAEAWQRCRSGELDPSRFNMGFVNWGIGEIRGSILYDLAAVNQDEMLPWDCWARMEDAYQHKTDEAYDAMLDEIADVVIRGDLSEIRTMYEGNADLRVPASLLPA